jgi:hypothetical protein
MTGGWPAIPNARRSFRQGYRKSKTKINHTSAVMAHVSTLAIIVVMMLVATRVNRNERYPRIAAFLWTSNSIEPLALFVGQAIASPTKDDALLSTNGMLSA